MDLCGYSPLLLDISFFIRKVSISIKQNMRAGLLHLEQ